MKTYPLDLMSVIRDLSLAQAQQFQREREAGLIDPRETPVSDDDSWYRQQDEDEQWIKEQENRLANLRNDDERRD